MPAHDPDKIDIDAPIFDPAAFRLPEHDAALIEKARRFGRRTLAPRAAQHDRDASFPIENFRDLHKEGLLAICVPEGMQAAPAPASPPTAWPRRNSAAIAAPPR